MGMSGGQKQSSTSQTVEDKEVKLPPWVDAASQANYALAEQVANRPYQQNPHWAVTPLDTQYFKARGMLGTLNDYMPWYSQSANAARAAIAGMNPQDIDPSKVVARQLADTDLSRYMTPYTANVEARAIENAARQGRQAQRDLGIDAAKKGAFGGSRQAIQAAVQGAETTRGIGDLSAKLRQEAYENAQAAATGDIQREYEAARQTGDWRQAAQIASREHELKGREVGLSAARDLREAADAAQRARLNEIATKIGVGQMYQDKRQQVQDMMFNRWQKQWDYPLEQVNIRLAALGMSPYGHSEHGTSTTTGSSKTSGGGGGGLSQMMGILPMLGSLFSDERAKTDIEPVGKDRDTGLKIYAYRYKKDPKSYPKVIGPMAQDVEKKYPQAVRTVGRRKVVDLTRLGA